MYVLASAASLAAVAVAVVAAVPVGPSDRTGGRAGHLLKRTDHGPDVWLHADAHDGGRVSRHRRGVVDRGEGLLSATARMCFFKFLF